MKLSIIIPVYNTEKYLQQCINSILKSSFSDYELLLIDDGSTDDSGQICDEYAIKDKRIRVFHQENGGVSKARNVGIDNANAPWITFIDADDWISGTFLENLYKAVEEHPDIDFVQAGCTNYRNGTIADVEQHYEFYYGEDKEVLFSRFRGLSVSKLYKKNILFEKENVRYDKEVKSAEDFLFTLDYIYRVNSYVFLPEVGYYYRRDSGGSITHTIYKMDYEQTLYFFRRQFYGIVNFVKTYNIQKRFAGLRYQQMADSLVFAVYTLYREPKFGRAQRIQHLKNDYTKEQLRYLRYVSGKRNRILFSLLRYRQYKMFDWFNTK